MDLITLNGGLALGGSSCSPAALDGCTYLAVLVNSSQVRFVSQATAHRVQAEPVSQINQKIKKNSTVQGELLPKFFIPDRSSMMSAAHKRCLKKRKIKATRRHLDRASADDGLAATE